MEKNDMTPDSDIFTRAWEDEAGGITHDERREEPLPADPEDGEAESGGDGAEASDRETPETDGASYGAERAPGTAWGRPRTIADREREIGQFAAEYPGVMPEDIPKDVWDRVRAGESLAAAYARHEAAHLRRENLRLETELAGRRQAETNRQRAAGSQMGAGAGTSARDPFDDGWELEW